MHCRKKVGEVTVQESNRLFRIFRHRNALIELGLILPDDDIRLRTDFNQDLEKTNLEFQRWWDDMWEKYQWESCPEADWEIDFETCEVFISHES